MKQVKDWAQKLVDDDYEKAKKEGKVPRFSHADKLGVNWHSQFLGRHPDFRMRIQREMEKSGLAEESVTAEVVGEQTTTTTAMEATTATTNDNDEVIAGLAAFVRSLPSCNES